MIVVGGSAGGINAACKLLRQLKPEMNAVIIVILHIPERGESQIFVRRLQGSTGLPCRVARGGMAFKRGHVYLAPPGYHWLIGKKEFRLGKGPPEGGWRSSIDTSFRSAAASWDSNCIGIILSGLLSDGTAGVEAIKRCGGQSIAQELSEAEYPNMPLSVLRNVGADECLRLVSMGKWLISATEKSPKAAEVPEDILMETRMAEEASSSVERMAPFNPSIYSCPECGGALWDVKGAN